ncbi:MAG: hypothetical protein IJQ08_01900 [Synergistaceae bacterium]|nr:hypothetical protein [Synergistaceae bacterium]
MLLLLISRIWVQAEDFPDMRIFRSSRQRTFTESTRTEFEYTHSSLTELMPFDVTDNLKLIDVLLLMIAGSRNLSSRK